MKKTLSSFFAFALAAALFTAACGDGNEKKARAALEQWLDANVAGNVERAIELGSQKMLQEIAKKRGIEIAKVKAMMTRALSGKNAERLASYTIESGKKSSGTAYAFVVAQELEAKATKKKRRSRERLHVVLEGGAWRVDPVKTEKLTVK